MRFAFDGHEIDYEVRGEGRPLVLLHGLTTDRRVLIDACEPVLAARPGWRRIYLDLPGHGASKGDPSRAFADALVDALTAFVLHVAPSPEPGHPGAPVVLAYAYGAYLAQALPRALSLGGLFLLCPVIEADFGKRLVPPRRIVVDEPELPFGDDPRERLAFDEVAVRRTRAVLARFQALIHPANIAVDAEVVAAVRFGYAHARPYAQAVQALDGPVAIVCGRHDHWVGFEDALRIARWCKDASYAALPGCGHLLPIEAPDELQHLIAGWLARCEAATAEGR